MDFTEKTIQKDYKFRGRIMTVRVDQAELPNGKPCVREVCVSIRAASVFCRSTKTAW